MGPIEDLNFEVILKDDKFRDKVDADIAKANELNTSLSRLLELSKALPAAKTIISKTGVKNAEDLSKALAEIKEHLDGMPESVKIITSGQEEHRDAVEQTNTALSGTESLMRTLAQLTGVAFSVATIRRFVSELVSVTGQFEVQKMALGSMLQDLDKADEIFAQLRQNALNSPYTFQDLTKFAKQLTAFNIPADQLVETEKRLADVAAGLGVDMGRIILAYGQVKAAGALKGQELRQFTEAGVPILEQLAKQIEEVEHRAVSLSEVFQRVSKKQISFEMVEEAFKRMTSEGGKFYNMQEVLVNTLQGKIGKLRDVWQQALYDMGTNNEALLKGAVDVVTKIVANLDELGKRIPELITAWGAYKTTQIAVEVASNTFAITNHKVLASLKAIGTWISKNPYALLAAAIAAVTIEAVRFGKQMYESTHRAQIAQKEFNEAVAATTKNISSEREELRKLAMVAGNELNTMKQRTDAIDVINAQYSEYLRNLGIEKVSIDNLGTSYNALRDAIANKYLAELKEQTVGRQQAAAAEARAGLNAFNAEFIRNTKISRGENAGKNYGAGGIGLIQGKIERLIDENPMFDKQQLTNEIAKIYHKYGLDIAAGSKTAGDLYKVVEDYVEAGALLASAERDFNNFAKGYGQSLGLTSGGSGASDSGSKTWGDATKKDKEAKERISDIQREVQILERFLNQRKEAEKYLGESASSWMATIVDGKSAEYFATLEKQILDFVTELRGLGDAGNDAADAIEGRLGTDAMTIALKGLREEEKAAEKADKALLKYLDTLEKWANSTQDVSGTGAAYGISKAIADYKKSIANNDTKFFDMVGGQNVPGGFQASMSLWARSRVNALAKLKQDISKYADDIFKEQMRGYDLSNWNDKTLEQINNIKKAIEGVEVPKDIRDMLEKYPELLKALEDELKRLKDEKVDKTVDPEKWKKIQKSAKYIATQFISVANSLKAFADASGNESLSYAAETIGKISENLKAAEEGYKAWGGWWGAIIGGGTNIITQVLDELTESEKKAQQVKDIIDQFRLSNAEKVLQSSDGLFGTNWEKKIHDAKSVMEDMLADMTSINEKGYTMGYVLSQMGLKGLQAYDENGILNKDSLEILKAKMPELDFLWDRLIEDVDEYYKALGEVDKAMESLFGDIASSAADQIIDSWIEAGNAALDYADILDDVAKSYAKMLIQSMIMETFLDPITDDLKKSFMAGDYENAMAMIAGAMEGISDSAPMFEQILSAFDPYFKYSDEANSVGNGIKGITEDTANLLASYINAIRQDVSVIRGLQEKGFASIDVIGQAIPTLNDYMNQVAANTFDTAQNTQRILAELQSVIGAEGTSGSIVRVQVA